MGRWGHWRNSKAFETLQRRVLMLMMTSTLLAVGGLIVLKESGDFGACTQQRPSTAAKTHCGSDIPALAFCTAEPLEIQRKGFERASKPAGS